MRWSWEAFFVPQNRPVPAGSGFGLFSAVHLGVLAVLAIGPAALVVGYRRPPPELSGGLRPTRRATRT